MTRITRTTYRCNQCPKEEHDQMKVLNWLIVGNLRNEHVPQKLSRGLAESRLLLQHSHDFCSLECLAEWAMEETQ